MVIVRKQNDNNAIGLTTQFTATITFLITQAFNFHTKESNQMIWTSKGKYTFKIEKQHHQGPIFKSLAGAILKLLRCSKNSLLIFVQEMQHCILDEQG